MAVSRLIASSNVVGRRTGMSVVGTVQDSVGAMDHVADRRGTARSVSGGGRRFPQLPAMRRSPASRGGSAVKPSSHAVVEDRRDQHVPSPRSALRRPLRRTPRCCGARHKLKGGRHGRKLWISGAVVGPASTEARCLRNDLMQKPQRFHVQFAGEDMLIPVVSRPGLAMLATIVRDTAAPWRACATPRLTCRTRSSSR